METKYFVGIDLAKNVFQIHGADVFGNVLFKKRLMRDQLPLFMANLEPSTVAMEACASAHDWARRIQAMGHEVKLISPQLVKPFVKGNKTDGNDAEAICDALRQKNMRFVPIKSVEQQDIQSLHRIRTRLVSTRTGLVCQMRGLLLERGFTCGVSISRARREIPKIIHDQSNSLTPLCRQALEELHAEFMAVEERIKVFDKKIDDVYKHSEICQRVSKISGVGPKTSTAFLAAVNDAREFKNGRHFAAWLGLVPKQRSSGNKVQLLGISKRGDKYLRTLLVHGARAVLRTAQGKSTRLHTWAIEVAQRRGNARAIVAIANKMARMIWVLMAKKQTYKPV